MALKSSCVGWKSDSNLKYSDVNYWNNRYANEDNYEWFKSYSDFRHIIKSTVDYSDRILVMGCGNSNLSEDMYNDGYHNIVNIDYSSVVIEKMKNRSVLYTAMQWLEMDATKMNFPDQSFDVVIEKGTLDAMMVGEKDPWNVTEQTMQKINSICEQTSRILKANGRFISVTFGQPHFRRNLYARLEYNWSFEYFTFGDTFHYYIYVMTKGKSLTEDHIPCKSKESSKLNISEENTLVDDTAISEDFLRNILI